MHKHIVAILSTLFVPITLMMWLSQSIITSVNSLDSTPEFYGVASHTPTKSRQSELAFLSSPSAIDMLPSIWITQTVDSAGDVGRHSSLALDSNDMPHISYTEWENDNLKYAYWDGSAWVSQTVDTVGSVGFYTSIALDSGDNPHISYLDNSNDSLKYAYWNGATWVSQTVDASGAVGSFSSLALDSNNYPHISYLDDANFDLKYAYWNGSSWILETVDSLGLIGYDTSLALDSNDSPHISYFDNTTPALKYAFRDSGVWISQTVDFLGNPPKYNFYNASLALDSNDVGHISYFDFNNIDLKYANNSGGTWSIQTVDSQGNVGHESSIAVDSNDTPHISYYDGSNPGLKYAHLDGNSWISQTVDLSGLVGRYNSLALASNDAPHISYYDFTNNDLRYAVGLLPIEISKVGPTIVAAGDIITYGLEIANFSQITLTNLVITDAIPNGASYFGGGTLVGNVVSWTVPSLTMGEVVTRQFFVTATETITNTDYRVSTNEGYVAIGRVDIVTVVENPITGLQAANSSPTHLGDSTTLTATIASGSHVTYLWYFGNEETGSGRVVSYTYPASGMYTAVVTASNSISSMTTSTIVTITQPNFTVYLPIASKP